MGRADVVKKLSGLILQRLFLFLCLDGYSSSVFVLGVRFQPDNVDVALFLEMVS